MSQENKTERPRNFRTFSCICILAGLTFGPSISAAKSSSDTELATQADYRRSIRAFGKENFKDAANSLPNKEGRGFIPTLERGWLGVLRGKADPAPLVKLREDVEKAETLRVTTEAKRFFYKETEEGYVPGEHEVVALHIITGMAFAQKGDCPKAMIEARKAIFYLDNTQLPRARDFDDAAVRLWLGSLWAACGDWGEARVSFRKASHLDPSQDVARRLAAKTTPPKRLAVVLSLPAFDIIRKENFSRGKVRPYNGVAFGIEDKRQDLVWMGPAKSEVPFAQGPSINAAYDNHLKRNFEIRNFLDKTRYNVNALGPEMQASSTEALGVVAAASAIAVGVIAGGATVVGMFQHMIAAAETLKDLASAFILPPVMGYFVGRGVTLSSQTAMTDAGNDADRIRDSVDPSFRYRFVRFLPWRVAVLYRDEEDSPKPSTIALAGEQRGPFLSVANPTDSVRVDFFEIAVRDSEGKDQKSSFQPTRETPAYGFDNRIYALFEGEASPIEGLTYQEAAHKPHLALGGWFANQSSAGFGNPIGGIGLMRHSPRTEDRSWESSVFYNGYFGWRLFGGVFEVGARIHDLGVSYGAQGGAGLYLFPLRIMARKIVFPGHPEFNNVEISAGLLVKCF